MIPFVATARSQLHFIKRSFLLQASPLKLFVTRGLSAGFSHQIKRAPIGDTLHWYLRLLAQNSHESGKKRYEMPFRLHFHVHYRILCRIQYTTGTTKNQDEQREFIGLFAKSAYPRTSLKKMPRARKSGCAAKKTPRTTKNGRPPGSSVFFCEIISWRTEVLCAPS